MRGRRRQAVHQSEQSLHQRPALIPLILQLSDDLLRSPALLSEHLSPSLLQLLLAGDRLFLPLPCCLDARPRHLDVRPRPFRARRGALRHLGAFGDNRRQFLPIHMRDCARRKRACGAQNGEILQPVSVNCVTLTLDPIGRDDPEVRRLYADFVREADGPLVYDREEAGIDLDEEVAKGPPTDLTPPSGVLLLARVDGEPAGLGGVRYLDTEIAEVKSMYVAPAFRGTGLGRQILARLDEIALEHGCRAVRLDTSDYLTPAVGLYRSAGYREVPAYNENPKADLWFERVLRQDG
jgi:GNAT superfamily N-acetyltransferase